MEINGIYEKIMATFVNIKHGTLPEFFNPGTSSV
ncbi:MAG: hypothetical protein BWY95_00982 [Bacteroidetes bacterium ADurb.BinA104]|nr:MAG: hypothetical protein BWY95_00982 [Bacteroidetes bacterium ADurb.BinA104]